MRITELYSDVIAEDRKYEYKAVLNPDNPVKWAKSLVGYANGDGLSILTCAENFVKTSLLRP